VDKLRQGGIAAAYKSAMERVIVLGLATDQTTSTTLGPLPCTMFEANEAFEACRRNTRVRTDPAKDCKWVEKWRGSFRSACADWFPFDR
jgi:hypothetical protein